MKILHFLTNCRGAVTKSGLLGAAFTLGMTGWTLSSYFSETPAAEQEKVRELSQIIYSGGELPRQYSGMNLTMGRAAGTFATAEERAGLTGGTFDGGDAGVEGVENMNLPGMAISRRNLDGASDGLGMGGNDAKDLSGASHRGGNGGNDGNVNLPAIGGGKKTPVNSLYEGSTGGGMSRAAMARAGGTEYGSGATGGYYGASGGAVGTERQSRVGAGSISGGMNNSSTLIAATGNMRGAHASSYVPSSRDVQFGQGAKAYESNSLRGIAKQSGKIAMDARKGEVRANEGTDPFMASYELPGGVYDDGGVDDDVNPEVTTDEDGSNFEETEEQLNNSINDLTDKEQERKNHRTRLVKTMLGVLSASFIGMMLISTLKEIKPWGYIGAIAVTVAVGVAIAAFMYDAGDYINKYGSWGTGLLFMAAGALGAVALVLGWTAKNGKDTWMGKLTNFMNSGFGSILKGIAMVPMYNAFTGSTTKVGKDIFQGGDKKDNLKNG